MLESLVEKSRSDGVKTKRSIRENKVATESPTVGEDVLVDDVELKDQKIS